MKSLSPLKPLVLGLLTVSCLSVSVPTLAVTATTTTQIQSVPITGWQSVGFTLLADTTSANVEMKLGKASATKYIEVASQNANIKNLKLPGNASDRDLAETVQAYAGKVAQGKAGFKLAVSGNSYSSLEKFLRAYGFGLKADQDSQAVISPYGFALAMAKGSSSVSGMAKFAKATGQSVASVAQNVFGAKQAAMQSINLRPLVGGDDFTVPFMLDDPNTEITKAVLNAAPPSSKLNIMFNQLGLNAGNLQVLQGLGRDRLSGFSIDTQQPMSGRLFSPLTRLMGSNSGSLISTSWNAPWTNQQSNQLLGLFSQPAFQHIKRFGFRANNNFQANLFGGYLGRRQAANPLNSVDVWFGPGVGSAPAIGVVGRILSGAIQPGGYVGLNTWSAPRQTESNIFRALMGGFNGGRGGFTLTIVPSSPVAVPTGLRGSSNVFVDLPLQGGGNSFGNAWDQGGPGYFGQGGPIYSGEGGPVYSGENGPVYSGDRGGITIASGYQPGETQVTLDPVGGYSANQSPSYGNQTNGGSVYMGSSGGVGAASGSPSNQTQTGQGQQPSSSARPQMPQSYSGSQTTNDYGAIQQGNTGSATPKADSTKVNDQSSNSDIGQQAADM